MPGASGNVMPRPYKGRIPRSAASVPGREEHSQANGSGYRGALPVAAARRGSVAALWRDKLSRDRSRSRSRDDHGQYGIDSYVEEDDEDTNADVYTRGVRHTSSASRPLNRQAPSPLESSPKRSAFSYRPSFRAGEDVMQNDGEERYGDIDELDQLENAQEQEDEEEEVEREEEEPDDEEPDLPSQCPPKQPGFAPKPPAAPPPKALLIPKQPAGPPPMSAIGKASTTVKSVESAMAKAKLLQRVAGSQQDQSPAAKAAPQAKAWMQGRQMVDKRLSVEALLAQSGGGGSSSSTATASSLRSRGADGDDQSSATASATASGNATKAVKEEVAALETEGAEASAESNAVLNAPPKAPSRSGSSSNQLREATAVKDEVKEKEETTLKDDEETAVAAPPESANATEENAADVEREAMEEAEDDTTFALAPGDTRMTTVALYGICDVRLVDFAEWPEFFEDMRTDVEKECKRHGDVVRVCIDEEASMGTAFICFAAPAQASACHTSMHKRFFAGRQVSAELCGNEVWKTQTGAIIETYS